MARWSWHFKCLPGHCAVGSPVKGHKAWCLGLCVAIMVGWGDAEV